ncbi:DUF2612 domain-containing protein [Klebsiella aerogenes]|uniref:DUF2612 domain-containing protein n=1 Tax=Klebsiella aerogenes TaxID=548 RepID=UPI0019069F7C|nr:DUF2612 domain-containing protein [Klebsiella aerogenes]MBK0469027.1 DUF2612 domain-containing protein [Klebsiella aerogenes]
MSKYTDRISNYHAGKQKFFAHVDLSTRPLIDISHTMKEMISAFDIDTAVGKQLDILGEWIGRKRRVSTPISGVYFSWDTEKLGWDQGVWQGPFDPDDGFLDLSDEVYRLVLKVKIAINHWNGQNDTLPDILDSALAGSGIRMAIVDNQDMSISIWILPDYSIVLNEIDRLIFDSAVNKGPFVAIPAGYVPSRYDLNPIDQVNAELWWAIQNGYLTVKAAGVKVIEMQMPSNGGNTFFGFDVDNEYISGFDNGSWGVNLNG